ncbi:MAG: ERAP1-like C-terminal domain-containing protein, partial [Deltaproteobacteria bacterium]|nr:ERAP1-like C-terminal domain-containing protein [Deltaproteobacteria bacterium]
KAGEGADTKELRPELLRLVAGEGKDEALIKEATALAWKWLDDHKAVQPELVGTVLHIAARYGDQKLFDRIHKDALAAKDRTERVRLIRALGSFSDPAIVKQALAIALTNEFELREASGLLQGGMQDPRTRELTFTFVKDHFDDIEAKLPPMFRPYMAYFAVGLCDDSRTAEIKGFLEPRMKKLDGGEHALAQAMEQLSLCSAQRKAQTPAVAAFFAKQ